MSKFTAHDRVSAEIAAWCAAWLPDDVFASCIAHGARGWATAQKLRQIGTQPGIADWLVLHGGRAHFPEIKTGKGSMSTAQRGTRDVILRAGGFHAVVHSLDDFVFALGFWKIPILDKPRGDPGLPNDELGL